MQGEKSSHLVNLIWILCTTPQSKMPPRKRFGLNCLVSPYLIRLHTKQLTSHSLERLWNRVSNNSIIHTLPLPSQQTKAWRILKSHRYSHASWTINMELSSIYSEIANNQHTKINTWCDWRQFTIAFVNCSITIKSNRNRQSKQWIRSRSDRIQ